jgi:hypothetical protein
MTDIHTLLRLQGDRYSKNLQRYLRSWNKKYRSTPFETPEVYMGTDGTRYIGRLSEGSLYGSKLMAALVLGGRAIIGCYLRAPEVTPIENFWRDYVAIGGCAIDPDHSVVFLDEDTRWQVEGDVRRCIWCGKATQVLRRWTETVEREAWVNEAAEV